MALALITPLGMPGLALANAVQNSAHAVVLFWLLCRRYPSLANAALGGFVLRVVLSGAGAGAAVTLASGPLGVVLEDASFVQRLVLVALAGGAGIVVYGAGLGVLRVREAGQVLGLLRRRARNT